MSAFSLLERIAVAAERLPRSEQDLFEDIFVNGLTREDVCVRRRISVEQFATLHRSMMRSLCGVVGAAQPGGTA